jgi:hypothetical protein
LTENNQPKVIEIKKGESRISSNIADPAWATLGDHHQAAHKTTAGEILCERQVITEIIYITLFHVGSYNSHYTFTFTR